MKRRESDPTVMMGVVLLMVAWWVGIMFGVVGITAVQQLMK